MAPRNQNSIPAGWRLEHHTENGKIVEYYTNDLGQKFYTMEDLMRYVNYAMKAQLSIYAPPSPTNPLSTAKPCSKGKRKRIEKSSPKKEKQKKTNSTAKNGGTKKISIIKFCRIFCRLSQKLNKPIKRRKHINCSAQKRNIKDSSDKSKAEIAASTHRVPIVLPPRESRRLSGQAPEYVPDFDPLFKY